MGGFPTGTVTFLFTDIEGSTRLWDQQPAEMEAAIERHDLLVRSAIESHGGYIFSTAGDSFAASFARADQSVRAAIQVQEAIATSEWSDVAPIRIRIGLHTGEAQERGGDYFGPPLNLAARVMSAANGGQIVLTSVTAEIVRGVLQTPYRLLDLGEHRLHDLSTPYHIFGLVGGSLPDVRRALRTVDGVPGNLTLLPRAFVGREAELAALEKHLEEHRLVTVVGAGGTGKTRTSIQAAADAASKFPGGVWFVDLTSEHQGDELAGAVASVVGVVPQGSVALVDAVADALRFRPTLLILDNCEHVTPSAAGLANRLLKTCGDLRIIATSREPLRSQSEYVFELTPLSTRGSDGGRSQAAELFIDRAGSEGVPRARLEAEAATIEELCARLDGLPLAIELAASRARSIAPAELLARMNDRFRILKAAGHRDHARHETLRAAIDWSYQLLDREHQVFLDRLSVFSGRFDVGDAALVAAEASDEIDTLDALGYLVDRSIVVADHAGLSTYWLLESVRAYAAEQLAARRDTDAVAQRHAERFAQKAAATRRAIVSPKHVATLDMLVLQTAEYRNATAWARSSGDNELAVRIAAGFCGASYFWLGYGALDWLGGITTSAADRDLALRAELLGLQSRRALYGGDIATAIALAEQSIASDPGAPSIQARSQMCHAFGLRNDPAAMYWGQSLIDVARESEDQFGLLVGAILLGPTLVAQGRGQAAMALAQQIFDQANEYGSDHSRGWAHWIMGTAIVETSPEGAEEHYKDAWRLGRQERNRYLEANALVALLESHIGSGAAGEGAAAARETLSLLDETADSGYFTRVALSLVVTFLAGHGQAAAAARIGGYLAQFGSVVLGSAVTRERLVRTKDELIRLLGGAQFEDLRRSGALLSAHSAVAGTLKALQDVSNAARSG